MSNGSANATRGRRLVLQTNSLCATFSEQLAGYGAANGLLALNGRHPGDARGSSVRGLRVTSTVLRDVGDSTSRQLWLFVESEVAEGDDSDQSLIAVYDR